jgi:protease I
MADQVLEGLCIAVLTADGFEQVEVTGALELLDEHGAAADVVSLRPGTIQGMNTLASGELLDVDETVRTADVFDYDGLFLPGGFLGPDLVRQSMHALEFVRTFEDHGKPIATSGHGAQVLISAGLMKGRRLAARAGIQDDVRNAGGEWIDARVVHDDNWVSSRGPQDLAAFGRAMIAHFALAAGRPAPRAVGLKGLIVGTAAVAAAGFAVQRRLGPSRDGAGRRARGANGVHGVHGASGPDAPTSYVLREP